MARKMSQRGECNPESCIHKTVCSSLDSCASGRCKTLAECKVGDQKVIRFICPNNRQLCQKLTSMGLVEGVSVEVIGTAPLGDPMLVTVGSSRLALRRDEAVMVELQ